MNKIITTAITVCAVLATATAYGAGAASSNSSKQFDLYGQAVDNSTSNYIVVQGSSDQRFLDNSMVSAGGIINGQSFWCTGSGSIVANVIDVKPTASEGSLQVNASQLSTCYFGTPPQTITMHCRANGHRSDRSISNGSSTIDGTHSNYHWSSYHEEADCTITADQVNIDYSDSFGFMNYVHYVPIR